MRIAIVSGSRADEGPLRMVQAALQQDHTVDWQSLTPAVVPNSKWQTVYVASTSAKDIANILHIDTDFVVLLGDRYEILGAAMAANIIGLPIAHLSGGDITEGSQDDCYRHAITKLSHLHFATCEESAARIIQMGEDPERVHVVGCPGVDRILQTKLLGKCDALLKLGLEGVEHYNVGCLHPNTLGDTADDLDEFFGIIRSHDKMWPGLGLVLIGPNGDAGAAIIRKAFKDCVSDRPLTVYRDTLDGDLYLSLLKHCHTFIGNSSAMFYEAPVLGAPLYVIGDRQKGRKPHKSDGHAAERIAAIISSIENPKALLRKRFHDMRT